ncbi:MAG TPA: hypothetical protein DCE41_00725 [Cytophagales bacterium]|nr:hypothetical protein [Cytophagales bacterium]HAA23877.1 hypothetical protein [Cytophagales bacterium]HAP64023.1 hypothetical protein [Cytophagales bacterium]
MTVRILSLITVLLLPWLVWANGGPIDGSGIYKTGDIELTKVPAIELLSEDLQIRIEGDYSWVEVTYQLVNRGAATLPITYGFPVDFLHTEAHHDEPWQSRYLTGLSMELDGERLAIEHEIEEGSTQKESTRYEGLMENVYRRWQVTQFTIRPKQAFTLQVKYKIMNGFEDWGTSKEFFPSFDNRSLLYDFSPAQGWGSGRVGQLSISVDASEILSRQGSISFEGLDFSHQNGLYEFMAKDFDFSTASPLSMVYDNGRAKLSEFLLSSRMSPEHIRSVTASSTLQGNYAVENLTDGDYATAWVEGVPGQGLGQSIEIELNDVMVGYIGLLNGYTKSATTYNTNARVKRLRVDYESVDYADPSKTRQSSEELTLEDRPFQRISDFNLFDSLDELSQFGDGSPKFRKITLTILEVYPGSQYEDTCITELFLLSY